MASVSDRLVLAFALLAPPLAWLTYEIGLAVFLSFDCSVVRHWLGPAWGAGALLACVAAFGAARRARQSDKGAGGPTTQWMARIAFLGSGIFALAILFQTIATLLVPPCAIRAKSQRCCSFPQP